jgi:serine/threonine-protein kinase
MVNKIILGKRYEVLKKIGAGGMADVYKGKDLMLNRYVAIKVLKKEFKEDESFVKKGIDKNRLLCYTLCIKR